MTDAEPKRRNVTVRVLSYAGILACFGALLASFAVQDNGTLPLHLPWYLVFGGFFLAGMAPMLLEVQGNSFSLSLSEIPLVVGILSLQRAPLLACGAVAVMLSGALDKRRTTVKVLFNVPLTFLEMTVAVMLFDLFTKNPHLHDWHAWIALAGALSVAILVSTTAVNIVIVIAGDSMPIRQAIRHSLLGMANSLMSGGITVLSLIVLDQTLFGLIPLAFVGFAAITPMRKQAMLQRRYDNLLALHEFTAGLTSSNDLDTTLKSVLQETARVLRASDAAIVLPQASEHAYMSLLPDRPQVPVNGDALWRHVIEQKQTLCIERGSLAYGNYLATAKSKDIMAVPLIHGEQVIGALVVRDRLGDVSTFDQDDLAIFATMANQTTVTLENLRLIDSLRNESAEREHQALHDELTGLGNRLFLYRTLDEALDQADPKIAVAVLDLNRFKEVNDTLGHHAGDEVLVQTAKRLRRGLPSSSFVARLGGDEFAIVLRGISSTQDAISKISALEAVFSVPFELETMSLRVDASIGVAVTPDHGADRVTLLKRADIAMYAAKSVRGSAVRSYDPSQEQSSARTLELVGELRKAIEADEIEVYFQPKADLVSGSIYGAESLARWTHKRFGFVGPNEFIPLAEQAGLIDSLTTSVLFKSLSACAEWRTAGHNVSVAVNLDAQTLLTAGFPERVFAALDERGLEPSSLTLEITERELVRELDQAAAVIDELRSHGVSFSIDDFGTGYSSLAYLTRLHVDEIKIDRSFVIDVVSSPQNQAIVKAVSDIAKSLGATTVVEGIEDGETWAAVAGLGCTLGQGYHLSRPVPQEQFLKWLGARSETQEPSLRIPR